MFDVRCSIGTAPLKVNDSQGGYDVNDVQIWGEVQRLFAGYGAVMSQQPPSILRYDIRMVENGWVLANGPLLGRGTTWAQHRVCFKKGAQPLVFYVSEVTPT